MAAKSCQRYPTNEVGKRGRGSRALLETTCPRGSINIENRANFKLTSNPRRPTYNYIPLAKLGCVIKFNNDTTGIPGGGSGLIRLKLWNLRRMPRCRTTTVRRRLPTLRIRRIPSSPFVCPPHHISSFVPDNAFEKIF